MWDSYKIEDKINITHINSIFEAKRDAGYSFPGEYHNFWECVYVISGKICATGDERVYHLTENDIIFHQPMQLHKYYVDDSPSAELFIFSFTATGQVMDFFKNKVFNLNGINKNIIENMIAFFRGKWHTSQYQNYFLLLDKTNGLSQLTAAFIIQLLLSLYDGNEDTPPALHSREAQIYENAVVYMSSNIEASLSISDIAFYCKVSETSLKNIFRKFSGMGVHKYFIRLKLQSAVELLKNDLSVTETAEKLGFSSQGHFTSVFKREIGFCPSQLK